MRSRNIVRLVKQEGRSRGKLEHACVFCAVEIFDLCAAKVYDASNIKEEISSTSDRAKKVLPLRHDGVLFERASLLDVFYERERMRSEIRDCEIEMQRTKARHTRRENDAKTSVANNNNNNNT